MTTMRSYRALRLPPGMKVVYVGRPEYDGRYLEIQGPDQPNAYTDDGSTFPGLFSINVSDQDPQLDLITMLTMWGMHEAIEFVKLPNEDRFADPHPVDEDAMWTWLRDQIEMLLSRYRDRWPVTPDEGT